MHPRHHDTDFALAVPVPRSHRVPLPTGLTYHVLEWPGPGAAAQTVFLVHGFLDFAWSFEAVAEALAVRFRVIAPDLRGHGESDRVGAGGYYHFMDYLADLDGVVRHFGGDRCALVGHSMGGSVTAYYAGTFPERVTRLALLEGLGPPEDPTPLPERAAGWIATWTRARERAPRGYASVEAASERLIEGDPRLDRDLALRLARRGTIVDGDGLVRFRHDPVHVTRGPYPFREDFAAAFLRRIACPTLFVIGADSGFEALGPAYERRLAEIADVRRVTIAGAGHMMQRHRPAELAALLLEFLEA